MNSSPLGRAHVVRPFFFNRDDMPSLEEVDTYPVPDLLVPRIARINGISEEYAGELLREAKRMLYLYALCRESVSPSEEIDMAWHEMLMFTRFYRDFADFIGVFVHHDPTPGPPDGGKQYERTRQNYAKYLGISPDPNCWTD